MKLALLSDNRLAVTYGDEEQLLPVVAALAAAGDTAPAPATPFEAACEAAALSTRLERALSVLLETGQLEDLLLPPFAPRHAPIPKPNRILAIGRNYAEHAKELGNAVPDEPVVFLKASQSVIGPDQEILVPDGIGRVDYEGELLVVLGKGGKNIPESEAMGCVVAYSCFNDVTAREKSKALQSKGHPWFLAKSLDTFGPLGPHLVTADELPDPSEIRVQLRVNGETKQDGTTGQMIHSIPKLIAYLSTWFALEPGDVIATGTPPGVGPLVVGDMVEVEIDGIGVLRSAVSPAS
ncbi:fumarylacetoacetate hydrolase family protein [Armatimonas rosea]|uniref:2-keto-4-pentenoate hydratase/2-oxohepta-3-ene-1,7-dioic acid hydratase in catechol pathway n=1 Tax=Armatimonas rosea TaxID=685828 RepID=A0A7W9SM96_ARMRO|nr:fumarylacetoacetate hydrolase family protein [Armatimonas rosea]MBB6049252.1 2-keto-4-pentenoate hydratase/2-oxohepta-3-ene-1,7-dioic acid hydratase in catechol pathway [Armatimonas rosea]